MSELVNTLERIRDELRSLAAKSAGSSEIQAIPEALSNDLDQALDILNAEPPRSIDEIQRVEDLVRSVVEQLQQIAIAFRSGDNGELQALASELCRLIAELWKLLASISEMGMSVAAGQTESSDFERKALHALFAYCRSLISLLTAMADHDKAELRELSELGPEIKEGLLRIQRHKEALREAGQPLPPAPPVQPDPDNTDDPRSIARQGLMILVLQMMSWIMACHSLERLEPYFNCVFTFLTEMLEEGNR